MINDTINPMGLDLTKNLHGHVRVETRDRWTGRVVDSQEKENLVTNALQAVLMSSSWLSSYTPVNLFYPIYQKSLGGLLLFDSALTESASNVAFPSSAKLVGYAGQFADSTNPYRGSFNGGESVITSNGYTTVWDFATSQANGTIASLGRTNYMFYDNPVAQGTGLYIDYGYGSPDTLSIRYMGYDPTNKYLYVAFTANTTIRSITLNTNTIYRIAADLGKIDLINCFPPVERLVAFKTLSSSDGTTSAQNYIYDMYANNFVYLAGTTLHIIAIDGTHSTRTLTFQPPYSGPITVTENYYWSARGGVVYQASKNTSAEQSLSIAGAGNIMGALDGDAIWVVGNSGGYIVYPDLTTIEGLGTTAGYSQAYFMRMGHFLTGLYGYSLWRPSASYLGTIANLDSPVTKTSSQTMKITYTLTEA